MFKPAALPAALLLASSFAAPAAWSVWSSIFLGLACMSQQFHAWSHMKRSELHPLVRTLQVGRLTLHCHMDLNLRSDRRIVTAVSHYCCMIRKGTLGKYYGAPLQPCKMKKSNFFFCCLIGFNL